MAGVGGNVKEYNLFAYCFNNPVNMERNKTYYGGTLTGGFAWGEPGGEFHVEWGTTVTLPKTQFNIYDVAKSVYIKIKEW